MGLRVLGHVLSEVSANDHEIMHSYIRNSGIEKVLKHSLLCLLTHGSRLVSVGSSRV